MTTYSIDTGDGNCLAAGLQPHTARGTAQRLADERGESVYLYADPSAEDASNEEFAPSEIEVTYDSPWGPVVEYGGHSPEDVEAALGPEWTLSETEPYRLSQGADAPRYRHAIVLTQAVADDIEQAIERSISHYGIVTLEWSPGREAELRSREDLQDSVCGNNAWEAWGETEDGETWRVHLLHREVCVC